MIDLLRIHIRALWAWEGRIGRLSFVALSSLLLLAMAWVGLLLTPIGRGSSEIVFWLFSTPIAMMLSTVLRPEVFALLLPFQWSAFLLSVKRLRDLEWSERLALLCFVPFANVGLFLLLALVPGWKKLESKGFGTLLPCPYASLVPRSTFGSISLALLLSTFTGVAGFRWAVHDYELYGWALFAILPFVSGLLVPLVIGFHESKTFRECLGLASLAGFLQLFFLIGSLSEGMICVLMATPLLFVFLLAGVGLGYAIQNRPLPRKPMTPFAPLFLFPLGLLGEAKIDPEPPLLRAETSVTIDAPPETVWKNVVTFSELPPPNELVFRTGIAYPIRATIRGQGVGAVRYCEFSTGRFVEPITVWDEPRLLQFSVTQNPPVMKEANPFGEVDAPHLHRHFRSEQGQFRLVPLPAGRTLLIGTTWYRHAIAPSFYWSLWSDQIIHAIHSRVLSHIKTLSEQENRADRKTISPVH